MNKLTNQSNSTQDTEGAMPKLGIRCRAQQIVLADGVSHYTSWREVDAKIKELTAALKAKAQQ